MAAQQPSGPFNYGIGPANVVPMRGGIYVPPTTDFGLGADEGFAVTRWIDDPRNVEMRWRRSFFTGGQHDLKGYDFDGNVIMPGAPYTNANRAPMAQNPNFIPFYARRPMAPVRLLRTIVRRYTALVFGNGRFPKIRVVGDPKSQDFTEALAKAEKLSGVMKNGRMRGGSCGTVGFSWRFYEGKPRVTDHDACNIYVHDWADREQLIPSHVSEFTQAVKGVLNPKTGMREAVRYWYRRDWTPIADVVFLPVQVTTKEPMWIVNEAETFVHDDEFCHFVWTRNLPSAENDIDGDADYSHSEEQSNSLDLVNSTIVRGGVKNLDPTLVLKLKAQQFNMGIRKGSDNALVVGDAGDARYLELAGSAMQAGLNLVQTQRKQILEATECVIPDADELTSAGMSSVAIQELFAPMTATADLMRESYGDAIERLLEQQITSWRRRQPSASTSESGEEIIETDFEEEEVEEPVVDGEGNLTGEIATRIDQTAIIYTLDLPDRVIEEEVIDESGNPTGEVTITFEPRELGEGGDVELQWPPYFPLSETEKQAQATQLTIANAGKPLMSHKTSVEQFSAAMSLDSIQEWKRLADQKIDEQAKVDGMFPQMGGALPTDTLAPTAGAGKPEIVLTPSAQAGMITVDEARASANLTPHPDAKVGAMNFASYMASLDKVAPSNPEPPKDVESVMLVNELRSRAVPPLDPLPEPDGSMTVAEFKAARAARGTAAGQVAGQALGQVEADMLVPEPLPAAPPAPGQQSTPMAPPATAPPGGAPTPAVEASTPSAGSQEPPEGGPAPP